MKKDSKKQRIKSILAALNKAEDKLHSAQELIEDSLSLIETAFLMHDNNLTKQIKELKKRKQEVRHG